MTDPQQKNRGSAHLPLFSFFHQTARRICAAYGCSLGGSFAGLLQGGNIPMGHDILGSSDLVPPLAEKISVPGTLPNSGQRK